MNTIKARFTVTAHGAVHVNGRLISLAGPVTPYDEADTELITLLCDLEQHADELLEALKNEPDKSNS